MVDVDIPVPIVLLDLSTKRVVNSPYNITLKGIPNAAIDANITPTIVKNISHVVANRYCKGNFI